MALSQIQCLDDNHVNQRTNESKPEFLYCEDQRLALETLLRDGREAFFKYLEARGLRGFLSDPELETLAGAVEPYDPDSELFPGNAEEDETPLSLHYWPDVSDTTVPQMDLGWPDSEAYRGVTRTTMYSQPPLDGQTHVKEIVRKMIAQAQRVIAVVMDIFTDVDIFRDLLDAGFKRKVSVYILLDRTTLPHFLSMCQRANMHSGHLKHLRVRCIEGAEFYTRSSTKVRGRMGHRFMFIDGDKAVSGSYSFTWMSSRLDRNLITVVTGHAVDAFDRLFRFLYVTSSSVDLRQVATAPEPEPEPLPQPASVAPPSAEVARKLYSPKYALLALGYSIPSPSAGHGSPKETQNPDVPETKKRKRTRASKEAIQDAPPIHPGLTNLEKACLMSYLPIWPEPDPPSDVIGFINVRDASKPTQVHLQRSEMFETSQAIRFSSPINMPEESLPEVAKPRQFTTKPKEMKKLQPAQDKSKAEESEVARAQPTQPNAGPSNIESKAEAAVQKSPASEPKCQSDKDTNKTLNTENKPHSNTPTNQDANHNTTPPHLNAQAPPQSSSKASTPNTVRPTHTSQTVPPASPQSGALPRSNTEREAETTSSTKSAVVNKAHGLESKSNPTCSNSEQRTQKKPHADSHIQTPAVNGHVSSSSASQSVGSTCLSENNHVSITTSSACVPLSSVSSSFSLSSLTSSSTTLNSPLPSSSASFSSAPASTPPIPKPRTIQLVVKDGVTSDGQKMPDFSAVQRPETSSAIHNKAAVATVAQTSLEKEPETVPDLQKISGNTTAAQKDAENAGNVGGAPQQKQSGTFRETKIEEADGPHGGRAGMQSNLEAHSDVLIADAPKAESLNIREAIPKEVEPMTPTSDCKLTPQIDSVATVQMETKAPERALTGCEPKENGRNTKQRKTYRAQVNETQRISYCELTPQEKGASETVNSTHTPVSTTHNPHISKDSASDRAHTPAAGTRGQQVNPRVTPADSMPNAARHNAHSTPQEPTPKARGGTHTPEKTLRLHLSDTHMPDLRSPMPERESRLLAALARTPSPDAFPVRTATSDSRTHTPDFRTPTPDVSDGYVSPREDSTTSEEYYECCDSPLHDPVFDQAAYRSQGTTEERVSLTHERSPNATSLTTSPAYMNPNARAATLGPTERNASGSETQSSSSSSLLEKEEKIGEEEEVIANEQNGREEEDEKGRKVSVAERRTEGESPGTERRGSEETKRAADLFKQGKDSTETIERTTEAPSQAPKRKKVLNQSAAKRLSDGGVTPARLTNEEAESRPSSTGDLKLKKVSSEGERPDKEKAVERAALGPSGVERRDRPRETEGQKLLHTPPRPPRLARPPRPLSSPQPSGHRPWGSSKLNQAESKALQGSLHVVNNTSPPRIPPSRPPPPVAAGAAGRKQAEVSRQPVAAQGKARAGQSQNQHPSPKPQTHSNTEPQLHQPSQKQAVSAHSEEEGQAPFSFSLSRLYSLKGMKDKMSKAPAQSKRGSTSSPVQRHKSTS